MIAQVYSSIFNEAIITCLDGHNDESFAKVPAMILRTWAVVVIYPAGLPSSRTIGIQIPLKSAGFLSAANGRST